jgi:hypothetical protein
MTLEPHVSFLRMLVTRLALVASSSLQVNISHIPAGFRLDEWNALARGGWNETVRGDQGILRRPRYLFAQVV